MAKQTNEPDENNPELEQKPVEKKKQKKRNKPS